MRLSLRLSVLILTCASAAAALTKAQETPPKTQKAAKTQETAPTPPAAQTMVAESKVAVAGHSPEASVAPGAPMAPIAPVAGHHVASAKEVRNLYIEPMINDLDMSLKAEFSKQLPHRIVIVSKPEDADAVMTGIGEWNNGTVQEVTGRSRGENDGARGSVQVLSKGSLLWASQAFGLLKTGGQRKVADRIVRNFKNALEGKTDRDAGNFFN